MIVQVVGDVKFPITLDPSVWIFDDRKVILEDFLSKGNINANNQEKVNEDQPWNRDEYQQKINPPVNKSLKKNEREQALENSYVMPIQSFLKNSEPNEGTKIATLHTDQGTVDITIEQLMDSVLLFASHGKPLKNDGPVHLYFGDGSNKNEPIKGITKIFIH